MRFSIYHSCTIDVKFSTFLTLTWTYFSHSKFGISRTHSIFIFQKHTGNPLTLLLISELYKLLSTHLE